MLLRLGEAIQYVFFLTSKTKTLIAKNLLCGEPLVQNGEINCLASAYDCESGLFCNI